MNDKTIFNKLNQAFSTVLEHDNFTLTAETSANDVDGWESITHMMIIGEVEKLFNIKFKLMALMSMENVGDLVNAIKSELN